MTLTLESSDLPLEIRSIPNPPQQLFTLGEDLGNLMNRPRLAIVGSRRVSPYGRHVTEKFASELAGEGVVIVSGLALGVDSIAHHAALQAKGTTVAVLPGGIERVYPRSHEPLAREIISHGGVLVSEKSGKESPFAHDFLIRNRLISGLSEGVLITEAAERSGSLNTARHALEQGRTVLAVPGSITSDLSGGTNNLIKAGAIPVTSTADMYAALGWKKAEAHQQESLFRGSEAEETLVRLISEGISSGEELLLLSKLDRNTFSETITMLEISGVIRALGANQWSLR